MKSRLRIILIGAVYLMGLKTTFSQTPKRVSTYLLAQYNRTLYDRTMGNNITGIGLGLQTSFNNQTKFKLTIELTGDLYLENDKIARLKPDSTTINTVRSMINLLGGAAFYPTESFYLSLSAGPSFINGQARVGLKSSFGFYFSESRRWTGKISYINIFNRYQATNQDFGSASFAVGFRLF